jgi:hypothetical protein
MADPANPLQELREIRDEERRWERRWERRLQPRRDYLVRYSAAAQRHTLRRIANATGRSHTEIRRILER